MKISLGWPMAAIGAAISSAASTAIQILRSVMTLSFRLRSMRKRPQSQLLFRDLPEPRQSSRLDDQEDDDQSAEHHQLDLLLQRDREYEADDVGRIAQDDRDQHDECRAEERAQDAPQAADDDHEEDQKRDADVEGQGLGGSEVEKDEPGSGHPAVERADPEGEQLRTQRPHADDLRGDVAIADRHPRPADASAH